jgi:hypothetical protein
MSEASTDAAAAAAIAATAAQTAANEAVNAEAAIEAAEARTEAAEELAEELTLAALQTRLGELCETNKREFDTWRDEHHGRHQTEQNQMMALEARLSELEAKVASIGQVTVTTTRADNPELSISEPTAPSETTTTTIVAPSALTSEGGNIAPVAPAPRPKGYRML